jgi:hypothetical protein
LLGESQVPVRRALDQLRQQMPFTLIGIASDNGSEFITTTCTPIAART